MNSRFVQGRGEWCCVFCLACQGGILKTVFIRGMGWGEKVGGAATGGFEQRGRQTARGSEREREEGREKGAERGERPSSAFTILLGGAHARKGKILNEQRHRQRLEGHSRRAALVFVSLCFYLVCFFSSRRVPRGTQAQAQNNAVWLTRWTRPVERISWAEENCSDG